MKPQEKILDAEKFLFLRLKKTFHMNMIFDIDSVRRIEHQPHEIIIGKPQQMNCIATFDKCQIVFSRAAMVQLSHFFRVGSAKEHQGPGSRKSKVIKNKFI